jgi:hypothetical protein
VAAGPHEVAADHGVSERVGIEHCLPGGAGRCQLPAAPVVACWRVGRVCSCGWRCGVGHTGSVGCCSG